MPEDMKKKRVFWGAKRFIKWMEDEGCSFAGNIEIQGPFPHADLKEPTIQVGDRGGKRPVARTVQSAIEDNGKEDYVILGDFWKKERIQEIDTDVALENMGLRGLRPARPEEWSWLAKSQS